jgi:hypothetical protein
MEQPVVELAPLSEYMGLNQGATTQGLMALSLTRATAQNRVA